MWLSIEPELVVTGRIWWRRLRRHYRIHYTFEPRRTRSGSLLPIVRQLHLAVPISTHVSEFLFCWPRWSSSWRRFKRDKVLSSGMFFFLCSVQNIRLFSFPGLGLILFMRRSVPVATARRKCSDRLWTVTKGHGAAKGQRQCRRLCSQNMNSPSF